MTAGRKDTIDSTEAKQLASLIAAATDAILGVDQDGRINIWNAAATRMFGYSGDEVRGRNLHRLVVPGGRLAQARRGFERFKKTGKGPLVGKTTECMARHRDGNEFPVELSVASFRQNGRWHAVGIVRDIRERKNAEAERAASRQMFTDLADKSLAGIYIIQDGVFKYANPRLAEIFGYKPEELIERMGPKPLTLPEDWPLVAENIRKRILGEEESIHYTFRGVTRDRRVISVEVFGSSTLYRGKPAVIGTLLDITDRRQAEKRIRQSQRQVRLLLDSTAEGIYGLDRQGQCTFANAACCRLLGYDEPSELLGANMHALIHHTRPDGSRYPARECRIYKAFRQGVGVHVDDEVLWRRDGTCFPAAYWSYPIIEDEEVVGAVVTFLDISDKIKARDALQESHDRLEASLHGAISAISKAVEARDPYTAGHQRRVAELACAIAAEMGLDPNTIEGIQLGALIHDLGKIHLPAEILAKPTRLNAMEFELIQTHAQVGYDILKDIPFPWPVADIAHQHHERLDGSGYPQGLKGDEIRLEARIVAVADVVEAMSSHRPYRPALGREAALRKIAAHRGEWFDPEAVDACLKLFREGRFDFT